MSEINETPDRGRGRSIDDTEPVTAARRVQNLESIRQQDGWQDFPECLPRGMRTTKGGKTTDFGNTKLRIIERIAINARFHVALAYFNHLTQDGARILRLKDLETCAGHFESGATATSASENAPRHRKASENPGNDLPSRAEHRPRQRSMYAAQLDIREPQGAGGQPSRPSSPLRPRVRFSDEFVDNPTDPLANQRAKRQRTRSPSQSVHQHPSRVTAVITESTTQQDQEPSSNATVNSVSSSVSHTVLQQNDDLYARTIFNQGSDAVSAPIQRTFDDLLTQVRDYNRFFSALMEERKDVETMAANPNPFADIENELSVAKDAGTHARTDFDQANSALDALKAQYGGVDSSLSRALLATVGHELEKAQEAVQSAFSEIERVESKLSQARARYASLDKQREEVDTSISRLQGQTRFWLERLGEVGVELTSQPGAMQ